MGTRTFEVTDELMKDPMLLRFLLEAGVSSLSMKSNFHDNPTISAYRTWRIEASGEQVPDGEGSPIIHIDRTTDGVSYALRWEP